jgi:hypothetical protein
VLCLASSMAFTSSSLSRRLMFVIGMYAVYAKHRTYFQYVTYPLREGVQLCWDSAQMGALTAPLARAPLPCLPG